jgi:hypothetical protein
MGCDQQFEFELNNLSLNYGSVGMHFKNLFKQWITSWKDSIQ